MSTNASNRPPERALQYVLQLLKAGRLELSRSRTGKCFATVRPSQAKSNEPSEVHPLPEGRQPLESQDFLAWLSVVTYPISGQLLNNRELKAIVTHLRGYAQAKSLRQDTPKLPLSVQPVQHQIVIPRGISPRPVV